LGNTKGFLSINETSVREKEALRRPSGRYVCVAHKHQGVIVAAWVLNRKHSAIRQSDSGLGYEEHCFSMLL
jgi:hypothetical protein